eukprot:15458706-Alexandrium_andersonii.AAC.1
MGTEHNKQDAEDAGGATDGVEQGTVGNDLGNGTEDKTGTITEQDTNTKHKKRDAEQDAIGNHPKK